VRQMAENISFTQAAVSKLQPPEHGRAYYRDSRTRGLYLCVHESGVKVFEYCRRMGGRATRLSIGRFPGVGVALARKQAVKLAGELAQGRNPAERRYQKDSATLGDLFVRYLDRAKPQKRTWPEDLKQFNRYLKPWQTRKLRQIQRSDIAALHARIGQEHGRYAANRLLALLSTMFARAGELGFDVPKNPAKGIKRFRESSRDRFLSADELQSFFKALEAELDDTWRDFFSLALLTGARRANLLAMKWADLSLDRGLWRVSEAESKNAESLLIVLAPAAVEILQRRSADKRIAQSQYVFPGRGKLRHVVNASKPWARILERAGIKNARIHDLRRTLGSWQAATGASLPIIGRSLGHRSLQATQVYARLDLEPVRQSVNTATKAMLTLTPEPVEAGASG